MLVSRISRRVIAEHHIALSDTLAGRHPFVPDGHVGVIHNKVNIKGVLERCKDILDSRPHGLADGLDLKVAPGDLQREFGDQWPELVINGHVDTNVAYIKVC